ncbi:MAG: FAD-binding oxidoreductase [Planctomycetes bacterium]|nr:FAD-binding oxidoreductase [Planctomycetota bacterium]
MSYEVAVIGGGIIGCSLLYHLAREGVTNTALFEKEEFIATGATSKSAGGIRQQFTTEINIKLSQFSLKKFLNLHTELDIEFSFHQHGYLFLATDEATLLQYRKNVEFQRNFGVDVHLLTTGEIASRWSYMRLDDVLGGTFCQDDGYTDPYEFTQGYAKCARKLGAKFFHSHELVRATPTADGFELEFAGGKVVRAKKVALCPGPSARKVTRIFGVDVPALPYRRQMALTVPYDGIPKVMPLTIDGANGMYLRNEMGGALIGAVNPAEPSSENQSVDDDWMMTQLEYAMNRIPSLERAELHTSWAGLYTITPDHHPIIDELPVKNLFFAGGFSGHGIMHSPAAGQCLAEIIAHGEATSIDISCLSFDRFEKGELLHELNVI